MLNSRSHALVSLCLIVTGCVAAATSVVAAESKTANAGAPADTTAAVSQDDDAALDLAEPAFRVVNLPTTMRLPKYKGDFELTHRFFGNFRQGSFSDQAGHFFGIDEGATVGFEYRFGVARHLEAVAYRMSFQQTVQFSAKYDALRQGKSMPLSISALLSDEGVNNYQDNHAPALGASVSRTFSDFLAVYGVPMWVHNTAAATDTDRDTFFVGVGGRLRIRPTVYITGEVSPRVSGYAPGETEYGFAIEKRAGGHMFQLNFTNTFGTTFAQIARGAGPKSLSLGFNLSRKFF
jgi:hypothetical protein